MKTQRSKLINNWITLIIIGCIGFISIGLFIYYYGVFSSNNAFKQYGQFVEEKLKNNVKSEVLNRIDEIDYDLKKIIEEENLIIKQKINFLEKILLNSEIIKIADFGEKRKAAILKLEFFFKNDPDYLYFIMDPSGNILRSGTHNEIVGTNLYNLADINGDFFVRDIVKAAKIPEGLYVPYYWPKIKDGEHLKKTTFCLYLPEFDIIIGTGSYEEDIYKHLKKITYERIQSYYEKKQNYIFIIGYDGLVKVHSNSDLIGNNANFGDENLKKAHSIMMNKLKEENGFVTYTYKQKGETTLAEKTTYVHAIDQWQVYIGMGFHSEEIAKETFINSEISKKEHRVETFLVITLLTLISLISYIYIRKGLKIQKEISEQDDVVFQKLFNLTNEGIIIVSENKEILYQNNLIEIIFKEHLKDVFTSNQKENFKHLEKNIYLFQNKENREYFLNVIIEKIFYMGRDCDIFIINNISEQYIRENELQNMAYYDQLTALPNRRKLENDFEDLLHNFNKTEKNVLVMLDLDKFKNINDGYGHAVGDQVLLHFGKFIGRNLRKTEQIYRFGGEEFIILFKQLDLEKVKAILDEINNKFEKDMFENFGFSITFSAGATYIDNTSNKSKIEYYIKRADQLLYQAKNNGRRKVEIILKNTAINLRT